MVKEHRVKTIKGMRETLKLKLFLRSIASHQSHKYADSLKQLNLQSNYR